MTKTTTRPENVKLNMRDELTGEAVTRTIDISNALTSGATCWELIEKNIRKNLQRWIDEAGNDQHETILTLLDWEMI